MEIVIVVAIWTVMVKRGVEDLIHAARGNTPRRYEAARTRRSNGAAGRYWGTLWDDTFEDLLTRHNANRARRAARPSAPTEHPDTARSVLRDFGTDLGHWARGTWQYGWEKAARRRQERLLRDSAGRDTVPGEVVPNAQDRDEDRPQDGDRPGPEPHFVPREDGGTDLRFGDDPEDPNAVNTCPTCRGQVVVDGTVCPSCLSRQQQRDRHYDAGTWLCPRCKTLLVGTAQGGLCTNCRKDLDQHDNSQTTVPPTSTTTREGPTTMTATTTEVVGLDSAIRFCEDSARAYRAQIQAIEQTQSALAAGEVTGPAAETFSQAMEQSNLAAESMDAAAAELIRHKQVQEAYRANQGAGNRDFILAGQ